MQANLHRSVREAYRKAVAVGHARDAFDLAVELLSARAPWLTPPATRRLVADMLSREPSPSRSLYEELPQ